MKASKGVVYWLPRVLSLLFVGFLSLFALDVFGEYQGLALVVALVMHLLPSLVLLAVIAIAWRYELVGVLAFLGFAVGYVFMVGLGKHWSWYAGISGPSVLMAAAYWMSWWQGRKLS